MKLSKFLKFASIIGLGAIASTPLFMLTSCSNEPSIKQYKYDITFGSTKISDIKSSYIKSQVLQMVSVALSIMDLNLCTSNQSLLTQTPEDFAYFMGNSWTSGGSTYVDESQRINFGITNVTISGSGAELDPESNKTGTISISNVTIEYGFFNPNNGTQKYTDISVIQQKLNNNPNYNKKISVSSATYTATFNLIYNEQVEVLENASDYSMKGDPTLTAGSNNLTGQSSISSFISNLNKLAATSNPASLNQSEIKVKYSNILTINS